MQMRRVPHGVRPNNKAWYTREIRKRQLLLSANDNRQYSSSRLPLRESKTKSRVKSPTSSWQDIWNQTGGTRCLWTPEASIHPRTRTKPLLRKQSRKSPTATPNTPEVEDAAMIFTNLPSGPGVQQAYSVLRQSPLVRANCTTQPRNSPSSLQPAPKQGGQNKETAGSHQTRVSSNKHQAKAWAATPRLLEFSDTSWYTESDYRVRPHRATFAS